MTTEITQRRNKVVNKIKGRREKADRRQKIEKLITQLDRRSIVDRRNTKDRRLSKQKIFLFPVTQQGITIEALKDEKIKLTKLLNSIITSESFYLVTVDSLKDAYSALSSQESKEEVLFQWYKDSKSHFKSDVEYLALISQLNFILKKEMEDAMDTIDKYLSKQVDLINNREAFLRDMQSIQAALAVYSAKKAKYIYPHYQDVLSLS